MPSISPHGWRTGSEAYQGSPTNLCEIRPYLLAAVGLEVQSNRILTCLIADRVAITFGLEVIKRPGMRAPEPALALRGRGGGMGIFPWHLATRLERSSF